MAAEEKTKNLLRGSLPLALLEKNEDNPNRMSAREFDLLIDNFEKTGITDAILVRPLDFPAVAALKGTNDERIAQIIDKKLRFRIVGGHHRFDGAAFLAFQAVPVTIIMDPAFDDDMEKFQIVRMNAIRGKLDAQKFFDLYEKLAEGYSDEVLQDAFGFAEEAEFQKLIAHTAKTLPDPALQKKFKEAAAEVKTIDGLSKLLNEMFTKYGDTLPYGYMIVDAGGQRSMWLRVSTKTLDALDVIGFICADHKRTVDDIVGGVLRNIAKGKLNEMVDALIAETPEVELPDDLTIAPTKDNLEKVAGL